MHKQLKHTMNINLSKNLHSSRDIFRSTQLQHILTMLSNFIVIEVEIYPLADQVINRHFI